jgi:hypothetical protein
MMLLFLLELSAVLLTKGCLTETTGIYRRLKNTKIACRYVSIFESIQRRTDNEPC